MAKYRGVIINVVKDIIPGSDIKELSSGGFKLCAPKYVTSYQYAGSYPCSTLREAKDSIEAIYQSCKALGGVTEKKLFASIMNEE